jgi:hypothetical protein
MLGLTRARPERRADVTQSEPSSRSSPYRVNMKATLLCPAHSDTSRTLQRATTSMATKLCRRPRNVICGSAAPVLIDLAVPV